MDLLIHAIERKDITEALRLIPESDLMVMEEYGTALHYAVNYQLLEVVESLLIHGANPSVQNDWGSTALHRVVAVQNIDVTKLLISFNVDQKLQEYHGSTALHIATMKLSVDIFALLLRNDILDIMNQNGQTVIDIVIEYGWLSNTQLLLPFIRASPSNTTTILHKIVSRKHHYTLTILLHELQHYIDASDEHGETPYMLAVKMGNQKIIDLLDMYREDIKEPEL